VEGINVGALLGLDVGELEGKLEGNVAKP